MSSIRVRDPITADPPEWTIEWYSVGGDGCWVLLRNGVIHSAHDWKWQARLARRRVEHLERGDE